MKPRLLVTGGAGFLGNYLLQHAQAFTATGTLHQTAVTSVPDVTFHVCDLQQPEAVQRLMDRVRPEIIIHTACSDRGNHPEAIVAAAGHLATQTADRHIRLIHLSTDQIFDGSKAPYTETSPTCPMHPYGQAKMQAETIIASLNPQAMIIRTSLLYDLRTPDRQTKQLMQAIETEKPYRLFTDEWRNPMWVENLAEALLELALTNDSGILHIGGPQALNRWELGMQLLEHFQVTPTSHIQQGTIQESGLVRPDNLTLDSTAARLLLNTPLLALSEARNIAQKITC